VAALAQQRDGLVEGQRLRRALRLDVRPREAEDYATGALRGDAHRASHAQRTELRCRPTRAALAGALGGHVGAEGAQRCAEGGSPGPHLRLDDLVEVASVRAGGQLRQPLVLGRASQR